MGGCGRATGEGGRSLAIVAVRASRERMNPHAKSDASACGRPQTGRGRGLLERICNSEAEGAHAGAPLQFKGIRKKPDR